MPYKDPEKRRAYQRDYKRRQRAQEKVSNPNWQTLSNHAKAFLTPRQTVKKKVYVCQKAFKLPTLWLNTNQKRIVCHRPAGRTKKN